MGCSEQQLRVQLETDRSSCGDLVVRDSTLPLLQACHSLPIAAGHCAGAAHVARAHRMCLACNSGVVGDEMHLILCVLPLLLCGLGTQACSEAALTP